MLKIPKCQKCKRTPVVSFTQCERCQEWGCPDCDFAETKPDSPDTCKDCANQSSDRDIILR